MVPIKTSMVNNGSSVIPVSLRTIACVWGSKIGPNQNGFVHSAFSALLLIFNSFLFNLFIYLFIICILFLCRSILFISFCFTFVSFSVSFQLVLEGRSKGKRTKKRRVSSSPPKPRSRGSAHKNTSLNQYLETDLEELVAEYWFQVYLRFYLFIYLDLFCFTTDFVSLDTTVSLAEFRW